MSHRSVCLRCRRPERVCVCVELRQEDSRTRVVFVQHPREARTPVSTCRLAHLSLNNSEMYVAMRPEGLPTLAAHLREPGTMLLFPGPGAIDVHELPRAPHTLVVVDGTWINARKLVQRSPLLAALPRVGFTPASPSNYRIRREPAPHCLSTIEAVAYVLEVLEHAPGRYGPILGSFTRMVEQQLAFVGASPRPRRPSGGPVARLRALDRRLVLLFAEGAGVGEDALLQWVAVRHTTGDRFESLVRPARTLGAFAPHDLELPEGARPTESFASAVGRWQGFSAEDDVIGTWGTHPVEVLDAQGVHLQSPLDLRRLVSNVLRGRLGGVEALAALSPVAIGRPARRLAALSWVIERLLSGELRG